MPYTKEKQKEYMAAWYQRNKQKLAPKRQADSLRIRQRNIRFLNRIKAWGCQICGYKRCTRAIHFHHLRDKVFEVGRVSVDKYSLEKIKDEMRKCVRVCANCHSEIHAGVLQIPGSELIG